MFKKFSKILYIFFSIFIAIFLFILILKGNLKSDILIVYSFIFLLFPFLDILFDFILKDFKNSFLNGLSKSSFGIALLLLILTSLFILIGDKSISEDLSIYAYYFLIIGVLIEIIYGIFSDKKDESKISEKIIKTNYINKYSNLIKYKYYNYKNKVLSDIGEDVSENHKFIKNFKSEHLNINSGKNNTSIINQDNFYIKLIKYFFKKFIINIEEFSYLFYILSGIFILLSYEFSFGLLLNIILNIFLLIYLYSKLLGKKYYYNNLDLKNIFSKNYFLNKAVLFASLGLISGFFLLKYLKIGNDNLINFSLFITYFSIFYIIFYNTNKREILYSNLYKIKSKTSKIAFKQKFLFFIKKHIYLILNFTLVFSILIILGFKNGFFESKVLINNNDLVNNTQSNKLLTEKEKNKLINKIRTSLISDEVEINDLFEKDDLYKNNNGETENNLSGNNLILVKDFFKFTKNLKVGSKNNEVLKLEQIMNKLGYFKNTPDNIFDIDTKNSLTDLLIKECEWPETTKGILGNQAQQCLYSLKIK